MIDETARAVQRKYLFSSSDIAEYITHIASFHYIQCLQCE